jgi:type V secretory pathway adhesin AidA
MINHNNRPQLIVPIAGAASKKFAVLHAHKKMKVLAAKYISVGAIAASGSNYSSQKLQKSTGTGVAPADISGNVAVDSQAGVAAYGHLVLDVTPEIVLEAGETLYLDHALTGTLTLDGSLHLDVEIIGN